MNLLDFIFPKTCLECGKNGKYLCDSCVDKVLNGTFGTNNLSAYRNNFAVFKYRGVIRKAIISLKYKFAYDIADELVSRLANSLITNKFFANKKFVLIPIPLYWRRENFRGFNQSEILGKKIAEKMNWKFIPDLLVRNKNTKPQVGLKGFARHQNLSGVFSINPDYLSNSLVIYSSIVLFDDVYTTGSTIKEAKKILQKAGFNKVYSLTIAR